MEEKEIMLTPSANKAGMTSLEIAEVTGRSHKNVLRDIRNLLEQGINQLNFELIEYKDAKGETRPMYYLTPKGCLILASGYNAVLREKIIDRLFELEAKERQYKPFSAYPMLTTERKKAEELMNNTSMEVLEDASLLIENHILRRKLKEAGIEYKERIF